MWVVWQPLGAKGLLRSGLPQLDAFGPGSQASPVCSSSPPVPSRAAHQAHREQRGTREPSNCQCFGRLSGKAAWRGPRVPKLSQRSPLSPSSNILRKIYLLWDFTFSGGYPWRRAETWEFLSFQQGSCQYNSRVIFGTPQMAHKIHSNINSILIQSFCCEFIHVSYIRNVNINGLGYNLPYYY